MSAVRSLKFRPWRSLCALLAALMLAAHFAPAAGAASKASLYAKIDRLRARVASAAEQVGVAQRETANLRGTNEVLVVENGGLKQTVAARDATITSLTATLDGARREVAQLREGLPSSILAMAGASSAEFTRLVLSPARQAWSCDSYITGNGYWSYSFDSPSLC